MQLEQRYFAASATNEPSDPKAAQDALHRWHRRLSTLVGLLALAGLLGFGPAASAVDETKADVIVFGATPAGIAASIAAAKDGCQVLLVETTGRIGGLVTNGLSHTDYHSRESLSGAFLDFAKRVEQHYVQQYGADSPQVKDCDGGVFAEPKVNLLVFQQMLREQANIQVLTNQQLMAVEVVQSPKKLGTIRQVSLKSRSDQNAPVRHYACRFAIDASYEGDLMAMAGVRYRVGREGRDEYGESLAPESADDQLQAYNFRFTMTKEPNNRVTPVAPPGYQREDFVGVLEALATGEIQHVFSYPSRCIFKAHLPPLPNGKYDINDVSRNLVRLSLPGKNLSWPNGTDSDRQAVFAEHLRDQAGLLYFLQNDQAVPEQFRREAQQWGWCRDEFEETGHLPGQLYVREARRMTGMHVYTQQDSEHAPGDARAILHMDSIAMGDYGNNCHGTMHEGPRFGGKH
ncbi:MAG: FAD-dependent oxidoreductase, partial [Pirellulaceae bacterium]|nr:FAD-dependent oxidoreductase [Pirellulaceae bacterium]